MNKTAIVCAISMLGLSACAVGPDYERPNVELAGQYLESQGWQLATPADHIPRGAWWKIFQDAGLDQLEDRLNQSNQTIAQAAAQYQQSLALLQEAQAGFYPAIGANAGMQRTGAGSGGGDSVSTTYKAALSASWEIDLWGGLRRAAEAGQAQAQASQALLENARLSAQAQLALAYLQLYVADAQKRSLDDSVQACQQQLTITKNRYTAGVAGQADVAQAENQLQTLQVQAVDKGLQRDLLQHAIAVLIGQSPSTFQLSERTTVPHIPQVPVGLPSTLLQRRPDIAAAERQVAEANAQIGVAKAAYFPSLTLNASDGYNSNHFANWISLPNRVWSLGPALAATLFDGGKMQAATAAAQASYAQSVANYRQTVLTAFQDVEDNLASMRILQQEAHLQEKAVAAARTSARIVLNQYRAGTADMLVVAQANATLQSNQRAQFDILNSQLTAAVGLIKALGGGVDQ